MPERIPRVSIGFPVYNAEAGVAKAIQGFLSQDFADFEVIISDNASTDATLDICKSFAALDDRIRVERQPKNIGANRNFDYVFTQARGEFFMWTAHDDRQDRSFIRKCVAALDAMPNAVLVAPNVTFIYSGQQNSLLYTYPEDFVSHDTTRRLRGILRGGAWFAIYGLIRRDMLTRTRPMNCLGRTPSPGLGPDYRLVELALLGPFAHIAEPLFEYQMRQPEPIDVLALKLDPEGRFRGTMFGWWLKDLWRMTRRHGLGFRLRLRIEAEFVASARSAGSLHTEFLRCNSAALRAARQKRQWLKTLHLLLEKCIIDGIRPRS